MQYLHIRNLEEFNPGYKDRELIWCKAYLKMVNADPEFEMLCEIDKWRFMAFVMLELQIKKPIPLDKDYLFRKGFNFKQRKLEETLINLSQSIEITNVTEESKVRNIGVTQSRVEESRKEEKREDEIADESAKTKFLDFVFMTQGQYDQLAQKLGKTVVDSYVERLNNYIGSKGKKYRSHYHTILSWSDKDKPVQTSKSNSKTVDETNSFLKQMEKWEKESKKIEPHKVS